MSDDRIDPAKNNISTVYEQIKIILAEARRQAYRTVNIAMVQAYWNIGRLIVEEEQRGRERAEYGARLILEFSKRLSAEFGRGFDKSNLWNMRAFFLFYSKIDAVRRELSWTHYRLLLKIEREDIRQFYMEESVAGNWSTRQLERQINSFYYERLLASQDRKAVRDEIAQIGQEPQPEDLYTRVAMSDGGNPPVGIILSTFCIQNSTFKRGGIVWNLT